MSVRYFKTLRYSIFKEKHLDFTARSSSPCESHARCAGDRRHEDEKSTQGALDGSKDELGEDLRTPFLGMIFPRFTLY